LVFGFFVFGGEVAGLHEQYAKNDTHIGVIENSYTLIPGQ
jgi:hypothetical protein